MDVWSDFTDTVVREDCVDPMAEGFVGLKTSIPTPPILRSSPNLETPDVPSNASNAFPLEDLLLIDFSSFETVEITDSRDEILETEEVAENSLDVSEGDSS